MSIHGSRRSRHSVSQVVVLAAGAAVLWATQHTAMAQVVDRNESLVYHLPEDLRVWTMADGKPRLKALYSVAGCKEKLDELTRNGADPSLTFDLPEDIPDLAAGKHPWPAARRACERIAATLTHDTLVDNFMRWATGSDYTYLKHCTAAYDEAIKGGVSPSEQISDRGVTGSLQEIYEKHCVAGLARIKAKEASTEAPYRKVLKADKLKMALDRRGFIYLPRGAEATPAALAANNVWFLQSVSDNICPSGARRTTLQRFQFNAQHKRVSVTSKEFCGSPPASAYR